MLYLLQSGVSADLSPSKMSIGHLLILVGGIIIIMLLLMFFAAKHLSKAGPFEFRKNQVLQDIMDDLSEELFEHEKAFRNRVRLITKAKNTKLENIFSNMNMCVGVLTGIVASVPWPLFESALDNHFSTELLPENIDDYVQRQVDAIGAQYTHVVNDVGKTRCVMMEALKDWESIEPNIKTFCQEWASSIRAEFIHYCIKIIETCRKYEERFRGDNYRAGKILGTIAEYEKYKIELEKHKEWRK